MDERDWGIGGGGGTGASLAEPDSGLREAEADEEPLCCKSPEFDEEWCRSWRSMSIGVLSSVSSIGSCFTGVMATGGDLFSASFSTPPTFRIFSAGEIVSISQGSAEADSDRSAALSM